MKSKLLFTLVFSIGIFVLGYGQVFSNGKFVWDLDSYHNYPTYFHLEFRSGGLAIGEDNASSFIRNNSSSEITLSIKFEIRDFCGNMTTEIWPGGLRLKPGEEKSFPYSLTLKCKETRKEGNKATGIATVNCQVSNFVNLTEEAKKVTLEKEKKEQEIALKKKKEEEAKVAANKAAEEKKSQSLGKSGANKDKEATSKTKTAKASTANDDFWNGNPKATTSKPKQKTNEEIITESRQSVQKQTDDFWNNKKESDQRIEAKTNLLIKNANDAAAVQQSQETLYNIKLNETYASIEALMADFNNKIYQIEAEARNLTENKKTEWNSRVDGSFSNANEAGINAGLKIIGGIVNDAKEKKEAEYHKEKLEKEKNAKLKEIRDNKIRMLFKLRQELFVKFKEGLLPSASLKVSTNTLYYFVYAYDTVQLSQESPTLYVSNVFPITQYSDGTWPLKANVNKEIATLSPYVERVNGHYLTQEEAMAMQQGLIGIFKKTNGIVKSVTYKGKPGTRKAGLKEDFWETQQPKAKKEAKAVKKDDFWNN